MNINRRFALGFAGLALLLIAALAMAHRGLYGWTLFIVLPIIAGGLAAWIRRPATAGGAVRIGAIVGAMGCCLFLVAGAEGVICVAMALPVVVPLSVAGSLLAYWGDAPSRGKQPAVMTLLIPAFLLFDVHAKPPFYSVATSIVVNAAPERVWQHVAAFSTIEESPDWVLRTGLAYPIRTTIDGSGAGAPRSCVLSTGAVRERVVVWDEPRLLRFAVTQTPPPMVEMGLYGPIHPKHLDGYYIAQEGQFELTPLPKGRTLVVGTSWYRHGLWPAAYWRWWSDAVIHHIHARVLRHIRYLSERGA